MSKRLLSLTLFAFVLSLASAGYGEPGTIMLDFDETGDVNTEPGFTSFLISDCGKEINGITIDIAGDINDARRGDPNSNNELGIPVYTEEIYRDFVYGVSPSGVTIILGGLGVNQECDITIYAFDNGSSPERISDWTANGDYLFTTEFEGGYPMQWPSPWWYPSDDPYEDTNTTTADEYGRILLESTRNPSSPEGEAFAFVNGLVVVPKGTYVPPPYAQHPTPIDNGEDVPVNVILKWKAGGYADKHDVYFGTNQADVNDANRSNPLGVLVSQDQDSNNYDSADFLALDTTYYWRIDEVNDTNIWKGLVWSFTTPSYFILEDFDSYEDDLELEAVWKTDSTSAEVSVETSIAKEGKSMRYSYNNNLPPYYSEAYLDIADLGIDDPDWLGIGAEALVLHFYGEPTNPLSEQMYITLTDGDEPAGTATATYDTTNDTRLKQWNKLSIALTEFNDVNLANVSRITIGFGDGGPGGAGAVYFEDITLDSEVEVLAEVAGEVDISIVYQELEGFGAAGGWHEWQIPSMSETDREAFYDTAFGELGLDIYRLRNTYDQDSSYMYTSAGIITAAKQRNPDLKIMISSWGPPAYLKSNDDVRGGDDATLKKDAYDEYMYDEFAEWWADSLDEWSSLEVDPDYINIQNEPDFDAPWESCRFNPTENLNIAGYDMAFEAVWQELNTRMGSGMPKMLAPETAGFYGLSTYINYLVEPSHAYGWAHHLYNGGGSYNNPDGYRNSMNNFRDTYGYKPLLQTEFSKGGAGDVTSFNEAMNLAHLMHNALVFEDAAIYCYWELFWTYPKGLISFPNTINPVYYAFKHYSVFTDPGWYRVEASTDLGNLGDVRISAFKSPDNNELTMVIINLAYNDKNISIDMNGFSSNSSEIYRTSETENTVYIGPFDENGSLLLPARSITTIHSPALSNCAGILSAGYGLTSDIYPDCYVNYEDLKIITEYWLNDECYLYNDCAGADFEPTDETVNLFDLSIFAQQWMWCNNPEDPNCLENW